MVKLPKRAQSLYFSATGNTKKIIGAISKGLDIPLAQPIDITSKKSRETWLGEIEGDMLLVGIPVWHSTFPAVVLPTLKKLNGEGRYAVPVAVCGHAKFGACLPQVAGILKKQGFKIVAAGNFIGQHSYATDESPLGNGRPDEDDLSKARQFGRRIISKLKTDSSEVCSIVHNSDTACIQIYQEGNTSAQGRMLAESYYPFFRVLIQPDAKELCSRCNKCAESCPTGAIDADTLQIDNKICTRCWACVTNCPQGFLQKFISSESPARQWFKEQAVHRGEPQTYL
jgi:ferredoxin